MPNISSVRLIELERAERELQDMIKDKAIQWVGKRLGEVLAAHMANKRWEDWTPAEQELLRETCGGAGIAYSIYKSRLPK